jgi:hypothetical protein
MKPILASLRSRTSQPTRHPVGRRDLLRDPRRNWPATQAQLSSDKGYAAAALWRVHAKKQFTVGKRGRGATCGFAGCGTRQLIAFAVTVAVIRFTDLLKSIAIGMLSGLYFAVHANFHAAVSRTKEGNVAFVDDSGIG